jgi:two-component sensor histidine kinase
MLNKSHMHKTADAVFKAQDALAERLSYDEDMAGLMLDGAHTQTQAHDTLESLQDDPQHHIHHPEVLQLRAELATAQDLYAEGKAAAINGNKLLMQEMHHRMKNSLQLVQSLLNLQARQTKDGTAAQQLHDSAARVHVIGAMHDHLYHTEALFEIDMKPYIEGLLDDLRTGILSEASGRQITLDAQSALWNPDESLALGLILTELVTNALKYGAGTIGVYFREEPNRLARLIVEDDGKISADFDPVQSTGFGMKLISILLKQRGGSLTIDRNAAHTRFDVSMPVATI